MSLDDVEAREKSRPVQRPSDLTSAATDAIDELTLRDHRRDPVAVGFVPGTDDVVEIEGLAGKDHVTVELRRGKPQVEGASLVFLVRRIASLEPPEHLAE